jgi:outer membrane protein
MKCTRFPLPLLGLALLFTPPTVNGEQAGSPVTELSLNQAIEMALQNNLDIVIARLSTNIQTENIAQARGFYKPNVRFDYGSFSSRAPANNQLVGAQVNRRDNASYNLAWEQQLPTGGSYSVGFDNTRAFTNSSFFTFNPQFNTALAVSAVQPLLRNLSLTQQRQQLVVAQNGERSSRHQFQAQVQNIVREVANAYVDLVFTLRDLEVAQRSLQLAKDLLNNNRIQVEVGTMAPIDVLQAEAEVAQREEAVIVAEAAIRRAEDVLKRLINDPDSSTFWEGTIRPTTQPIVEERPIDVDAAVETALSRRAEVFDARVALDTADFNVRYTRNQMKPQVDLVGSLTYTGLGGDQIERRGLAGEAVNVIPGGYGDALSQLFGGDFYNWQVALNFSYPIGNSIADAANARAQVEYRQRRASITSLELQIAQEVRETARLVETGRKRIEATRVGRELAAKRLEAEQKKFAVGMSTNFFVVQAQRDLSVAEANELRAIIDYNKAIMNFERARGTLLERVQVEVKDQ